MGQIHFLLVYYRVSQQVLTHFILMFVCDTDVLTGFGESVEGVPTSLGMFVLVYRVAWKYCPLLPEKMGNETIVSLHM